MDTSNRAQTKKQLLSIKDYSIGAPIGEFKARLDFRFIAAGPARSCYFTHLETGEKFYLLAFRTEEGADYHPKGSVNFMIDPIPAGSVFLIVTERSKRGLPIWKSASLLPNSKTDSRV